MVGTAGRIWEVVAEVQPLQQQQSCVGSGGAALGGGMVLVWSEGLREHGVTGRTQPGGSPLACALLLGTPFGGSGTDGHRTAGSPAKLHCSSGLPEAQTIAVSVPYLSARMSEGKTLKKWGLAFPGFSESLGFFKFSEAFLLKFLPLASHFQLKNLVNVSLLYRHPCSHC